MTLSAFAELEKSTRPIPSAKGLDDLDVNRQNNEFPTLVAHELRSSLAAIFNALQVLRQCGDDATTREWVGGVLDRQTARMRRLIEDLLDLSRTRCPRTQLRKRPLDLAQLVEQVVETVRPAIEARSHVLEIALLPGPTIIEADPARLAQVLTNLLDNAAKYTDPGGQIGLTAKREGDEIVLRVWDTGIGIAPEMLPHVFDLYWQSSRAAEHTQGGLGIGLALVRQLVELHGGSVSAFSAGPGRGSEFVVRLPTDESE